MGCSRARSIEASRTWPPQLATCRRVSPVADCSCRSRLPVLFPSNCSTTPHSPSRAARKVGLSCAPAAKAGPLKGPTGPSIMPACCCASGAACKYRVTMSIRCGSWKTSRASSSISGSCAGSPSPASCPLSASSRHAVNTSSRKASFTRKACVRETTSLPARGPPCSKVKGSTTLPAGVCTVTEGPGCPPGCSRICDPSGGRVCTVSCASGSHGGKG
mmetsp:Transcript_98959/g.262856  ORF Transcript_98959/g.262856 Transcript_98959/m.262856 type:complete len:217 (+) Transcript_98959:1236-1886(+)